MIALLLAVVQTGGWAAAPAAPAVGDTVRIARLVAAAPDVRVRAEPLAAGEVVVPLAPPRLERRADGLVVRYLVALFRTGPVTVQLPAITLEHPVDGVDILPADSIVIRVASVLPAPADADTLPPRAAQARLDQAVRWPWRAALPPLVVLLGLALWARGRRRPRRAAPVPSPVPTPAVPLPGRWVEAGESRVAAAWGVAQLRQAVRQQLPDAHDGLDLAMWRAVVGVHRPDWPLRRLDDVLDRLERARFAPLGATDVEELLVETDELVRVLGPA